jgi:hypothetical protein
MSQKRRISELLPEVLQTDVLRKFLAASGDHLFQPGHVEYVNGYMGDVPAYAQESDVYVQEPSVSRQAYQVSPITVSKNVETGELTHVLFYEDLINKLRFQGALVSDHNRLFTAEYYSWGVPFDWDKWLNFINYVWLPEGPDRITLLDVTNIQEIVGLTQFVYEGRWQTESQSLTNEFRTGPLTLSTGMKIRFAADVQPDVRQVDYLVEGVGRHIRLLPDDYLSSLAWENPTEWDSTVWDTKSLSLIPTYVTMGRGSPNANPWSVGNRWFHRDVVIQSGQSPESFVQARAQRPILEMDAFMKMWDAGTQSRGYVNLVDTCTTNLSQILGKTHHTVFENCDQTGTGVSLEDNMLILFTNLRDPDNPSQSDANLNNKIYRVQNLRSGGSIVLEVQPRFTDASGAPQPGDCVFVIQGDTSKPRIQDSHINSSWYYTQGTWKKGQSRQTANTPTPTTAELAVWNQAPLFDVFDTRGNSLSDPGVYANSTFSGNTIVQYAIRSQGVPDVHLGFVPDYADVTPTNFLFDVTLDNQSVTYMQNNQSVPIQGMRFYATQTAQGVTEYVNFWRKSAQDSKQYVVNEFWGTGSTTTYEVDQAPAAQPNSIQVQVAAQLLKQDTDYTVRGNLVQLSTPAPEGARVQIRTHAGLRNSVQNGYFELPRNLVCNALNDDITQFSRSDLVQHAQSILNAQPGFVGDAVGINNWRDTAQDQGLGTEILQHRGSLLRLMALNAPDLSQVFDTSNTPVDPYVTITWAQHEYLRFYNKVIRSLVNLYNRQAFTQAQSAQVWLDAALAQVNVGKTVRSAWAYSGIEQTQGAYCDQQSDAPTWVPMTATRLGVTPVWLPEVFVDESQPSDPLSLRCHNGAVLVLKDLEGNPLGEILGGATRTTDVSSLSHPVAQAWLLFEQRQYESMPTTYTHVERHMPVDHRTVFSGKYRQTAYTVQERTQLLAPAFEKWSTFNQVDVMRNTQFDLADAYTWNYGNCVDLDGEPVPGHWRGIYFHFYDTDEPHVSPWHMLGFSQKPDWWDAEYGAAPYTSGNLRMWRDLEAGRIARGLRAGVYDVWARPGLLRCVPVDSSGALLSPNLTGMLTTLPSVTEAAADWKFGDRSPMENVWLTSVDSDFTWAVALYQTRPAQFMEYLWDGVREIQVFGDQTYSQYVNAQTQNRTGLSSQVVHRENPSEILSGSTQTYQGSCGIQHWFSEKLVHENLNVSRYLGNLIRGTQSQMGHKMAGFVNSQSLRVSVDSFGVGNTNSLLLPQEDITVELLRTPSVQEVFYTGVIVEFRGNQVGWRLIGYDSVDPFFTIVPANQRGTKTTVMIGNQRVTEYTQGQSTTTRIPYGTVFKTRQEVYDVLMGLGRYQASQGFVFDQFDPATSRLRDWSQSAREFLFWSQGPWAVGTYITLSPLATLVKYETQFGMVQSVGQLVNGTYSVLDRTGSSIALKDLDMLRLDAEISVKPLTDQGIYGLRMFITSMEHAIMFNNQTIFGDLIYDPLLNQRQSRFRVLGYRSQDWQGRLDAPGYMITQSLQVRGDDVIINNQIIPNFEKSVDDLRRMFEVDPSSEYTLANDPTVRVSMITQSVDPAWNQMATHLVGYQDRSYLTDLLVDRTVAFQFYQGMIQQKGTSESVQRLLRNTTVLNLDQQLQIFEEFGFRSAYYGANSQIHQVDILLQEDQVKSDPQQIKFTGINIQDDPKDQTITILPRDVRKLTSTAQLPGFKLRSHYGAAPDDLPTSGPVLLDEVTHVVRDSDALLSLYETQEELSLSTNTLTVSPGQRIWQLIHPSRTWDVYKVHVPTWQIVGTAPNSVDNFITTVTTSAPHDLTTGDVIILFGVQNAGVTINNTLSVLSVTSTTFDIDVTTRTPGSGGTIWVYRSVRFTTFAELALPKNTSLLAFRDLAYVDGDAQTPWVVYRKGSTRLFVHRQEQYKVDPEFLLNSRLYHKHTLQTRTLLTIWDPVKNQIPGVFATEIQYKTPYDPAQYTQDPSGEFGENAPAAWGDAQVGQTWWDLSTTRFLDYEIGTDSYRRQHWGSIAPGTTIDIYEWVRSPVPPASWANLVAQGTIVQGARGAFKASGTTSGINTPYVQATQLNALGVPQTQYYFWVQNMQTVPDVPHRRLSIQQLSALVQNPQNSGIRWWSALDAQNVLVGSVSPDLDADRMVLQLTYTQSDTLMNSHKQYDLIRPGDPRSDPSDDVWNKIQASLVEFNAVGDSVPDLRLSEQQRMGIQISPSQTMFMRPDQAREAFVKTINASLDAALTPVTQDPARTGWQQAFQSSEPPPAQNNQKPPVKLASVPPVTHVYMGASVVTNQIVLPVNKETQRIRVNWIVQGAGMPDAQRVVSITQVAQTFEIVLQSFVTITQDATYMFQETLTYYVPGDLDTPDELIISVYSQVPSIPGDWDPLLVDGESVSLSDRVLFKDQSRVYENGIYQLVQITHLDEQLASGLVGYAHFQRVMDLAYATQDWYLAQTQVTQGDVYALTTWYQTNQNVITVGESAINWVQGVAPLNWVAQVPDMGARNRLNFQFPFGSQVLVMETPENQNRWTIWAWTRVSEGVGEWKLVRIQGYKTVEAWSYTDWYADGYDASTVIKYEFDTLRLRDQSVLVNPGDVVKVLNTGSGAWGVYVKQNGTYTQVGAQNANLELSDRLWDYAKYQMGFDGGGFDSDGQGFEYDSRLELNEIWHALWQSETKTGFLIQDNAHNDVNSLLFVMVNRVMAEQPFVDWVFKTSFINLRGFSDQLQAVPFYQESKRESLISYVNEVKPYHVKIREFTDSRRAQSTYNMSSMDFDRPPYQDAQSERGVRILDAQNPVDANILSTDVRYMSWFNNHELNPDLIRRMRVHLLFDRVACAPLVEYAPGYSESTTLNRTVPDLVTLYEITPGDQVISGYLVKVLDDGFGTWSWHVRNSTPYVAETVQLCWTRVAFEHDQGAANRISQYYTPTPGQMPKDHPLLIRGCAGDLVTLDGSQFNVEDAWDQSVWDNIKGWSYTDTGVDRSDFTFEGGSAPRYITLSGTGTATEFSLPFAPQDPRNLKIWVSGILTQQGVNWTLKNHVGSVLVSAGGVGYSVNDVLTLQGGVYLVPCTVKVSAVTQLGAITQVQLLSPGSYTQVLDNPAGVQGGSGVNATILVRWAGKELVFASAPVKANQGPNIWVVESGSTFNPAVSSVLDVIMDGAGLNAPQHAPGHPEELLPVRLRNSLMLDVYTSATVGEGHILTQVYAADGITDSFDIGQQIWASSQLWVYVGGELKEFLTDYVVNMQYMRVVFLQAPSQGQISILSVAPGGASRSMGVYAILAGGSGYDVGDLITMQGGSASVSDVQVQVTAVSALSVTVQSGGSDYQPGDVLFYRYGSSSQTLSVRVIHTTASGLTRGIIQTVEIVTAGKYTTVLGGTNEWYTTGLGSGATMHISWAVSEVLPVDRGIYYAEPTILTQRTLVPAPGSLGGGSGLTIRMLPGVVRETVKLVGDGVTNEIILSKPANLDTILVTLNGVRTFDYNFDSEDTRRIGLNTVPGINDVLIVAVFDSSLFSLMGSESWTIANSEFTRILQNPPGFSPMQSLNMQVFANGVKLRPPEFFSVVADGVLAQYTLPFTPSDIQDLTVWWDQLLLGVSEYTLVGDQITFVSVPAQGVRIRVQYADDVTQNYDFVHSADTLTMQSWAVSDGDQMEVRVFTEDSRMSWQNDTWPGTPSGVYALSETPINWGQVQVFVDGLLLNQNWDYEIQQSGAQTEIHMGTQYSHTSSNNVQAYYPTHAPQKAPVAFRQFQNIYHDVQYLRLSDEHMTRCIQPVMVNSEFIWVESAHNLAPASVQQPGAVWMGAERIEYQGVQPAPTAQYPQAAQLVGLRRGTLGTPSGEIVTYEQVFHNGDGVKTLFEIPWTLTQVPLVVIVNDVQQAQGPITHTNADWDIVINPPSRVPGTYVQFWPERQLDGETVISSAPTAGNQNVLIMQKRAQSEGQSHADRTIVRDATQNQQIPGSYVWPYGDQGLQNSVEPQSAFLLDKPGVRRV